VANPKQSLHRQLPKLSRKSAKTAAFTSTAKHQHSPTFAPQENSTPHDSQISLSKTFSSVFLTDSSTIKYKNSTEFSGVMKTEFCAAEKLNFNFIYSGCGVMRK
jgi:hypothetical protein